jgi:hypothetical protein
VKSFYPGNYSIYVRQRNKTVVIALSLYQVMKRIILISVGLLVLLTGCIKDGKPMFSGTITIDNILYGAGPYYAKGFSVPTGTLESTLNNPLDLITILEDHDIDYNVRKLYFSTSNYKNSFSLFGNYNNESSASQVFNNLTSFSIPSWVELADSVRANQIWLYKTSSNNYAKIRVISTYTEKRDNMVFPYAECKFEWVYQPNGTTTFPGK